MAVAQQNLLLNLQARDAASGVVRTASQKMSQDVQKANQQMAASTTKATQTMQRNFTGAAVGAAALSAGVTGFATSFTVLDKAQLKVQTSTTGLARAQSSLKSAQDILSQKQLALTRSTDRLNALKAGGTATTQQLALAEEDARIKTDQLATAKQKLSDFELDLQDKTEKLRIAQVDLEDTYSNFLANIPSQLIAFGLGATLIFQGLGGRAGFAALKTKLLSTTLVTRLIPALRAVRVASIAAFITNPVGLALIGITTLITLLIFNVGGLQDKFRELGRAIFEFLEIHFKPLADAMKFFHDVILVPIGKALSFDMPEALDQTQKALDPQLTGAVTQADDTLGNMEEQLDDLKDLFATELPTGIAITDTGLDNLTDSLDTVQDTAVGVGVGLGNLQDGFVATGNAADFAATKMKSIADLTEEFRIKRFEARAGVSAAGTPEFFGEGTGRFRLPLEEGQEVPLTQEVLSSLGLTPDIVGQLSPRVRGFLSRQLQPGVPGRVRVLDSFIRQLRAGALQRIAVEQGIVSEEQAALIRRTAERGARRLPVRLFGLPSRLGRVGETVPPSVIAGQIANVFASLIANRSLQAVISDESVSRIVRNVLAGIAAQQDRLGAPIG